MLGAPVPALDDGSALAPDLIHAAYRTTLTPLRFEGLDGALASPPPPPPHAVDDGGGGAAATSPPQLMHDTSVVSSSPARIGLPDASMGMSDAPVPAGASTSTRDLLRASSGVAAGSATSSAVSTPQQPVALARRPVFVPYGQPIVGDA